MPSLNSRDLQSFLDAHKLPGPIIHCPEPTPTVEAAAQVMQVHPDQIVKSLVFLVAGQPVLVITCGTKNINRRPLADRFGVGKKQVKLASPEEVLSLTGYPAGTVPPFGHLQPLLTLIASEVMQQLFVYAGGGEENALMKVEPQEIQRVSHAEPLTGLQAEG